MKQEITSTPVLALQDKFVFAGNGCLNEPWTFGNITPGE
jgi:hypothetical protein